MDPEKTTVLEDRRRLTTALENPDRAVDHTFRATGIKSLTMAGPTKKAQQIAAHELPKTTINLYDRTSDQITLDEIERISISLLSYGRRGRVFR